MSYYSELKDLTLEELVTRFHGPSIDQDFYSEVAFQIRAKGKAGNDILWKEFDFSLDEERLGAIIFALSYPANDAKNVPIDDSTNTEFRDRLLTLLHDNRPSICAGAIDALTRLDEMSSIDAVLELYQSPSPLVRGAVLRYVARLHPKLAKQYLLESLQDPNYIVRENAIDELDDLDATEAIPYIQPLLMDEHPHVRQAARTAIENLQESLDES